MREERGQLAGDLSIAEPFTLWGSIIGNVTLLPGAKLYVRGTIHGNLTLQPGSRAHILGTVSGSLTLHENTKVILSGILGGDAHNHGGRLYIDHTATLMGKLKTHSGDTQIQPAPPSKS
ncbi:MAG TPA: hypothetical protein VFE58_18065 [Tepidisphaeraceae bacterium]|jgi:cytoskeletal protein CcmA (bactofilin family)|nr:hypothetical protein [Tepidisphaeraceae bacterium]